MSEVKFTQDWPEKKHNFLGGNDFSGLSHFKTSLIATAGLAASALLTCDAATSQEPISKPNVLFIAVDDLRPELGCYGQKHIKSPNIDRLANEGLLFERAYCQQAICMASRASLLSGFRPDKGRIYRNKALFEHVPDALSLNQHFLNNGYECVGMGKVYHHHSDNDTGWSKPVYWPKGEWTGMGYLDKESQKRVKEYTRKYPNAKMKGIGPAFENPDVPDDAYRDGKIAENAIKELNRLKDKQFFLAVGFLKPHLPFNAPKKYWDLYSEGKIKLPENKTPPKDAPDIASTRWVELRLYHGIPKKGPMPDDQARKLIHGYYACVSYTDALIGKILDELDRLKLRDKTIVILWGDHGWKLGDYGMWSKHTNFEQDTHAPMIISAPGMKARGRKTKALTEFVDIYPTLCDLAGIEKPHHLQGTSAAPLLDDPDQPWKQAAFSQYPRSHIMGYSMRTERYRYTEWQNIKTKEVRARELYDFKTDPDGSVNIAELPENKELVEQLSEQLNSGYKAANRQKLRVGWAEVDISPEKTVRLHGQKRERICAPDMHHDPLTATVLALESESGQEQAVLVSVDLCKVPHDLTQRLAAALARDLPGLDSSKIFISATHTHTGPFAFGTTPLEGGMTGEEYGDFLLKRLRKAIADAWANKTFANVASAQGTAAVGFCRIVIYKDGSAKMYGNPHVPNFEKMLSKPDHDVNMLFFWDGEVKLTGIVLNVACPAQVVENKNQLSADFWHEVRKRLKAEFSDSIKILPLCGAAGDMAPRDLQDQTLGVEFKRHWPGLAYNGAKIVKAVMREYPEARAKMKDRVALRHHVRNVKLSRKDLDEEGFPVAIHAVRIGDDAIVTNPFELYVDYGRRIKDASPAKLTFIAQLTGWDKSSDSWKGSEYLPTREAVRGGAYGARKENGPVGPVGGAELVDHTLTAIQQLWK